MIASTTAGHHFDADAVPLDSPALVEAGRSRQADSTCRGHLRDLRAKQRGRWEVGPRRVLQFLQLPNVAEVAAAGAIRYQGPEDCYLRDNHLDKEDIPLPAAAEEGSGRRNCWVVGRNLHEKKEKNLIL